jgi:hypothetical protein
MSPVEPQLPLSSSEQQRVQDLLDRATPQQRQALRSEAEAKLLAAGAAMAYGKLDAEESKAIYVAIEFITRLDCMASGGGWWCRSKRRVQVTQMYLGA